jgi:hypothetical protein
MQPITQGGLDRKLNGIRYLRADQSLGGVIRTIPVSGDHTYSSNPTASWDVDRRQRGTMQNPSILTTCATRKTPPFSVRDAKSIAAGATYSKHCSCSLIDLLQLHRWLMLCVRHGKNANIQGGLEAGDEKSHVGSCKARDTAIKRPGQIGPRTSLSCALTVISQVIRFLCLSSFGIEIRCRGTVILKIGVFPCL